MCTIDVPTPQCADEIAARRPVAQQCRMQIRVLMHGSGEED